MHGILKPGDIFASEFRITGLLGEGGFGAVYSAEQISTSAPRALKLMRPDLVRDEKQRARFTQEARIGAQIDSDHIVAVIGSGVDEASSTPWLAMELLKGESLDARVAREGWLKADVAHEVLDQVGHGLGAAHRLGIVHRDLKPENIYLADPRRSGVPFTVKVLDFGISKVIADASLSSTAAIGTPLWASPEQMDATALIGPATDVWAMGLLSFWLLTGRYFWLAANQANTSVPALLREAFDKRIPPPIARARELGCPVQFPPGYDAWFQRCVNHQPGARFPSANEARAALDEAFGARPNADAVGIATTQAKPSSAAVVSAPLAPNVPATHPATPPAWRAPPGQVPIPIATQGPGAVIPYPRPISPPRHPVKATPSGALWIGALSVGFLVLAGSAAWFVGRTHDGCPSGTHTEGGTCVPDIDEACDEGLRFKKGKGCVAITTPPRTPAPKRDDTDDDDDGDDDEKAQPDAFLSINCLPACESITVDGKASGASPARVPIQGGEHLVVGSRGTHRETATLSTKAGQSASVQLRFNNQGAVREPTPPPPPPPPPPPSKAQPVGPCNCLPDNLMCHMKCNAR